MATALRYRAFISYAHKDEPWAVWLHRRLESYRVPGRIVRDRDLASNRLLPIFRDRDELSTAEDLSATIREALTASEHLIVICSAGAAASRWVNEEIRLFKSLGRADRIHYLLIDDPSHSFPEAARQRIDSEAMAEPQEAEPLAADARPEGDGKGPALQKLVAGLLGVRLDEIVRREAARRNQRLTAILAASLVALVATTSLTVYALNQRAAAREQERQASLARDDALAAQAHAEQAQAEAEEVVNFLVDMFEVSDPNLAMGREITARELLDDGAQRIEREFAGQPLVRARLMSTMGLVYMSLGAYGQAEPLLQQSLELRISELGESHAQVAASLDALVRVQIYRGDLEAAEADALRAVAMREALFGPVDPTVADSLVTLYEVYGERGRYAEAESLLRRALAIREAALGLQHPETARAAFYLATMVRSLGRHDEANELNLRALEIQSAIYGNSPHPAVAESLNHLGIIELQRGNYDRAQDYYESYVAMLRALLPENSPSIAIALENLGGPFYLRGEYDQAAALLEEALEIRRKAFGDDHHVVGRTLVNLGTVLTSANQLDLAAARFREALPILRGYWGDDHPELSTVMSSMGLLAEKRGEFQEAYSFLSDSVAIASRHYGDGHPETASRMIRFARFLVSRKRYAEAMPLLTASRAVIEASYDQEHPDWVAVDEMLREISDAGEAADTL